MLFVLAALVSAAATHPELNQVHTVYLLPMSGNLDQMLAVRITQSSLFTVVTDPRKADAIFTGRIGPGFEESLKQLETPPPSPAKDADKTKQEDTYVRPTMKPLSHSQGSLFLVDRKTGSVLWSVYEPTSGSTASDVQRLAQKIAGKLEKDLKSK